MKTPLFTSLAFALVAISCDKDIPLGGQGEGENTLPGVWMYTEYGYSPGAGYFTEPVSPIPPQTLALGADMTVTTNIESLDKYRFYRMFEEKETGNPILALFEVDPGSEPLELSEVRHSYLVVREGNNMKLYYRWCIEGCHLGFRKVGQPTR